MFDLLDPDRCPKCDEPTVIVQVCDGPDQPRREVVLDPSPVEDGNLVWVEQAHGEVLMRYLRLSDPELPPPGVSRYRRHVCLGRPALAASEGQRTEEC
jgi:hypothetical protein